MKWLDPAYRWTFIIPFLFLLVWVLAEKLRRRRLIEFGDIGVMNVPVRLGSRFLSVLALTVGIAASVGILPLPSAETLAHEANGAGLEILLDARMFAEGPTTAGYTLGNVEDLVREVVESATQSSYSLFRSGSPLEVIVPETSDSQGLLILMNRLCLEWQPNNAPALNQSLIALTGRKASKPMQKRRVVVITAQPLEDIVTMRNSPGDPNLDILWARLPTPSSHIELVLRDHQGNRTRSERRGDLREFLARQTPEPQSPRTLFQGWSYVQLFAAVGFFALLSESLAASNTRLKAGDAGV